MSTSPRGQAPEWKRRKEPILDEYLQASIDHAGGVFHPETGHYAELIYAGCPTRERANEIKQALYRSAYHMKVSLAATVTPAKDGTFSVTFKAIDKVHAKAYILAKHGTDRSKWPYDPRRRGSDAK